MRNTTKTSVNIVVEFGYAAPIPLHVNLVVNLTVIFFNHYNHGRNSNNDDL